ncbi:ferritin-like domain-containing protein [Clostridium ganghwense]|uniref:Ferritin-like domain-containing protein n=1 Tax=Clostridium ganghwense TaxID=312089 RepID=A0ABT4CJR3_9CLOT|nr:ferritin family protein [Clostridium ganghwense]MCY6369295.1 ferritin-like domain-containing protein [Clostridium ganghwense]
MQKLDLINETQLGVAKANEEIKSMLEGQFRGETGEVGLYLAMARAAQNEGYGEIGEVLKRIAHEEAEHAARFAELTGKISGSTKENVENMLRGEIGANKSKKNIATKAKELGLDEVHDFVDESSRDEARHAKILNGILERYFK